ncbi:MAG: Fis family transcriptional regulator [Desulfuromonas sp.]|nr:MAG: Fis family transcriptional regulator [Desulfuromonas sp.]
MTNQNIDNLRHIFDCVPDGVISVDERLHITYLNRAAESLLGCSNAEVSGKPCCDVLHCDNCAELCPIREALSSGNPVINRDIELHCTSGKHFCVSVTASPLLDAKHNLTGGVLTFRDLSQRPEQRRKLSEHYSFCGIVSRNQQMREIFDVLPDIAASDATVLFHGESGAGKELFARAIHDLSPRKNGPLVTLNCGALPEPLLEAEIFGARKGSYTGSFENRPGRLELANGGTLFLDEIGDLPLPLQVKLLRVLENHEFQPLGASQPQKADVRFVAATHRNLSEMVDEGRFRRDLFFRLNVVTLDIPPLRDRREDIPLLVDLFLERCNKDFSKHVQGVAPEVCRMLMAHDYPGNVRELLNLVEQSVILCRSHEITVDTLPPAFRQATAHKGHAAYQRTKIPSKATLIEILTRHNWHRNDAADELGIDRTTLWRWMSRLGIAEPRSGT